MNDPVMAYDALHELCSRIGGHYVMWAYWIRQAAQLRQEAWEISPEDHAAVAAKRAEWRQLFQSLPEQAPVIAA